MAVNAAIHYRPDGFDTSRPRLMGRQAAGEGFLKAFVRHAGVDRLICYGADNDGFNDFQARVARIAGEGRKCAWIPESEIAALREVGCLYRADPGIATLAWTRRFLDSRAYSLCGVTHTTASSGVMDSFAELATAPVQPWDAVICTSRVVRDTLRHVLDRWCRYLEARIGARPSIPVQLPVIPLGVDCAAYQDGDRADAARSEIRGRLGIAGDDVAVLFFGRLSFHAKANPFPMYVALEQAARAAPGKVHLIQAGWFANDSIRDAFVTGARALCPSVNAVFVDGRNAGVREQIWFAADIFTSLSDNIQETFGLVPIEAMAAGLPVVVSDWDGYRDTVRHGVDGFLAPTVMPAPGLGDELGWRFHAGIDSYDRYIGSVSQTTAVDIGACAEAYRALFADAGRRREMGAAGRRRAQTDFDWKVVIGRYQELWGALAERRGQDAETAPRGAGPAHPLRDDPYALFASYPTAAIGAASVVALVPGADPERLVRLRRHGFVAFADPVLADVGDCQAVLRHLETRGPCQVASLLAAFAPAKRRPLHRSLGWLAKLGFITVQD